MREKRREISRREGMDVGEKREGSEVWEKREGLEV